MRCSLESATPISLERIRATFCGGGSPASPISAAARWTASGVRSSWAALAANRRCAPTRLSIRSSMPSKVSASRLSSPGGASRPIRSCRFSPERRRAVSVMTPTGRSTRPAIHQASQIDGTANTARAMSETISSSWRVADSTAVERLRVAAHVRSCSWVGVAAPGGSRWAGTAGSSWRSTAARSNAVPGTAVVTAPLMRV